ncbi:7 transmembrane receptor (Secretin family) domain-containing protein [Ditylenchus destructor]|nr:7 transmembrane receptor (Secretin family) domain-containing protein [Ditylenchus destructor]
MESLSSVEFLAPAASGLCRFSGAGGQLLPSEIFRSITCAHCLFYIYFVTPPYSQNYETRFCGGDGLLICDKGDHRTRTDEYSDEITMNGFESYSGIGNLRNCSCESGPVWNLPEFALSRNNSRSIEDLQLKPSLPPDFAIIVRQCCEAAARCCSKVLQTDRDLAFRIDSSDSVDKEIWWDFLDDKRNSGNSDLVFDDNINSRSTTCPATWDGWQCFGRSEPGIVAAKCPHYIFGDRIRNDIDGMNTVQKECLISGQWYAVERQGASNEWTDYSGCNANNAYALKLFAGLIAFSVTVITIIPALFIFSLHHSLKKNPMFVIHRQLLYSFLFSGFFYIFNCLFFAVDGAPGDHLYFVNHISCRLLFTVQLRYFRISTFSWMLGEGVYLYRLLMCTFASGEESLRPYFLSCWGFPFLITVVYSILRQTFDNEECWITPTKIWWIEWTIIGPCLVALSINLFLMLVIFYVLLKKLSCNTHMEPAQYTKAVRAVFMLVPVFGLHFLITIYRIQSYLHQIVNLVLDGLQGFVVVLIVCYTNKTVLECVRTWIQQRMEQHKLRRQSEDHRQRFKRSIIERNSESLALGRLGSVFSRASPSISNMAQLQPSPSPSPLPIQKRNSDARSEFFGETTLSVIDDRNGTSTLSPQGNMCHHV